MNKVNIKDSENFITPEISHRKNNELHKFR